MRFQVLAMVKMQMLVFWVESSALKDGDSMFYQKVGTYPPSSP
jgi:hypothetical protein